MCMVLDFILVVHNSLKNFKTVGYLLMHDGPHSIQSLSSFTMPEVPETDGSHNDWFFKRPCVGVNFDL